MPSVQFNPAKFGFPLIPETTLSAALQAQLQNQYDAALPKANAEVEKIFRSASNLVDFTEILKSLAAFQVPASIEGKLDFLVLDYYLSTFPPPKADYFAFSSDNKYAQALQQACQERFSDFFSATIFYFLTSIILQNAHPEQSKIQSKLIDPVKEQRYKFPRLQDLAIQMNINLPNQKRWPIQQTKQCLQTIQHTLEAGKPCVVFVQTNSFSYMDSLSLIVYRMEKAADGKVLLTAYNEHFPNGSTTLHIASLDPLQISWQTAGPGSALPATICSLFTPVYEKALPPLTSWQEWLSKIPLFLWLRKWLISKGWL